LREVEILKINTLTKKAQKTRDYVAEEKPLHILLDRNQYATIFCSPTSLKELAVGHLLTEGIIKSAEEIEDVSFKDKGICYVKLKPFVDLAKRLKLSKHLSRIIPSACGGPYKPSKRLRKIQSSLKVRAETVLDSVSRLNQIAKTFRETGGVHAAALYSSNGNLVAFAEDVGRHNAVDKVIGMGALSRVDFGRCFLTLSGRLTGDIVFKAAAVGLPIVASLAAPLDSGIAIAKDVDLTLIGFVRGKRMNIYTFPGRIVQLN